MKWLKNWVRRAAGVPALEEKVALYERALGPAWRTMDGHVTCPALMSDNHLTNIILGDWGSPAFRKAVEEEVRKRQSDDRWWRNGGQVSPRELHRRLQFLLTGVKVEELDVQDRVLFFGNAAAGISLDDLERMG